jgi:Flp pilus assembly protein TadD
MKKYLQDPNALFQQVLEYQKLNDILNAKKLCEYILNLYPDHHGAKVVLGNIYINNDSIENGIDLIKSALKEEKNNYYLYSLCGVALMKIGNYKDAEINFLEALKLNKNSPDMYFNLGL